MNIANKYEILQRVILRVNELADAKGVDKCVAVVDAIQQLNFLDKVLRDEDGNHEAAIKELAGKIDKLEAAGKDEKDA